MGTSGTWSGAVRPGMYLALIPSLGVYFPARQKGEHVVPSERTLLDEHRTRVSVSSRAGSERLKWDVGALDGAMCGGIADEDGSQKS
jgi:hypothetical protein